MTSRGKTAIAGKGGSGKTTIASVLARTIARRGHPVWAIDADSNPNLGVTLGIAPEALGRAMPIPRSILEERMDDEGKRRLELKVKARDVARDFGVLGPDGVVLMMMGRIDHAGAG